MAYTIKLKTYSDPRGSLTAMDHEIPFDVKRVYFINGVPGVTRGGHRHRESTQALVCVSGTCVISNNDGEKKADFVLDSTDKCLILEPKDWHTMHSFSEGSVLLVLASTHYNVNDYIDEPYPNS